MLNNRILAFRLKQHCASMEPHIAVHALPSPVSQHGEDCLSSRLLTGQLLLGTVAAEWESLRIKLDEYFNSTYVLLVLCRFPISVIR